MPYISDEEYQQFQAMRSGGNAQQMDQRSRFDASASPAAGSYNPSDYQAASGDASGGGDNSAAQQMQSAYQQQAGGYQMGQDAAPGVGDYTQRLGALAQQNGINAQWRPTAGAGGGYWTGVGDSPDAQNQWAQLGKQANAEQATAAFSPSQYQLAPGSQQDMQGMQSRQDAESQANAQQGAGQAYAQQYDAARSNARQQDLAQAQATRQQQGRGQYGGFGAPGDGAMGRLTAGSQNAQQNNANAAGDARQRAMQTATSNAWGT